MENHKISIAFFAVGSAIKFNKKNLLRSDGTSEYYSSIKLFLKNKNVGIAYRYEAESKNYANLK
jgi:hypothetical protein